MSFDDIIKRVRNYGIKRVAVAAAHDEDVLKAVAEAKRIDIANGILIGNRVKILEILRKENLNAEDFHIINTEDNQEACMKAVELVSTGQADMVMKGIVDTATFLKAILNKDRGLRTGRVLSHVAVFEVPALKRLITVTDAAMNIAPDLNTKKQLIENAVEVTRTLGIKEPKVAVICAVEVVNQDMQATLDASILSKMNERGQIKGCIVDGPLAIDNAVSEEAARHKGIESPVAGCADILLVPSIETGNVLYKTLTYMAGAKNGGIIAGASAPVILTSRADSHQSKLYSIALASLATVKEV